jgi:hypothetical protein
VSTISSLGTSSTSTMTLMQVLTSAASKAAQSTTDIEVNTIDKQIQNQLNAKIAALQNTPDAAVAAATQDQINNLNSEISTISTASKQYSGNSNLLSDMQTQLATMQTAAQNGDSATFDNALTVANYDLGNLLVIQPNPPFQADQVLGLKGNGLGIGDSASYDLSTPSGQAAAEAAVSSAQSLVQQSLQATSNNELIAGDVTTALTTQLNYLQSTQQQNQQYEQTQIADETSQLTQQAQNQEHVIELSLGNTQLLSNQLNKVETPLDQTSNFFSSLQGAVGETATEIEQQPNAALVSLLA